MVEISFTLPIVADVPSAELSLLLGWEVRGVRNFLVSPGLQLCLMVESLTASTDVEIQV